MYAPLRDFLHRRFRAAETRAHELNYLFWECTLRCNLNCLHCGSDCAASSEAADMPAADFLAAFDTIPRSRRAKPFTVVITGGEPLVRPDLPDIGRAMHSRGVGWGIVTNGWLYDEAMHRRLVAAGLGALTISLDGPPAEHDWLRGRDGSHTRALDAIAIAARQPRLNFDVVTCVNRRNLPCLQTMYDRLAGLGVRQWRLFTIIPIGRALQHDELHLDDSQLVTLMDFIAAKRRTRQTAMTVTFSCEGYLGPYECQVRPVPHFCHAGVNIASILADGTICACPNIDRHRFAQGNIHTDNLWEVWQTRFEPFRRRDWARQGACKDCRVFKNCLGGGMHNFHTGNDSPLGCHYRQIMNNQNPRP